MSAEAVLYTVADQVGWIRLNRPDQLNALSQEMVAGLARAIAAVETDPEVRVVVLTGQGRAFCAGGDLKGFLGRLEGAEYREFAGDLRRSMDLFLRLEQLPKPVIAAVNGVTVAGGLELILCCDIVIAAAGAQIGDGHLKYGVLPGSGSSVRLPRKLPVNVARRLLLTGELVPAETLLRWGLVNEVVPPAELEATVSALARHMAGLSPLGLAWVKQLAADGLSQPLEGALRNEITTFEAYIRSDDFLEGMRAFSEKRRPRFTGR
ncbi:enoyl-CoA hydratase/isomerase family protein [Chelatococcus reniformis]|uniref:Enoyl-CoA hydratase n=1 Tax=Chelatococcus reniformis TaxID=1494448 RepID=A0A916UV96_9HYPH|nr:enoyl-CoA hydratase/isomerase family protein [Chelatococcus reniformis]GGC89577.1 enoyl-CoA hydratase [Chelatococcus reniformis]